MLTRIRNAVAARHDAVTIPLSREKVAIAKILKDEGFIRDYEIVKERDAAFPVLRVHLRYVGKRHPVLSGIRRVSRPGQRRYAKAKAMPRVLGGMGVAIVTTPQGVMTGSEARRRNVGGEVICYVW
jgi:small subunit ribosomal protein S8